MDKGDTLPSLLLFRVYALSADDSFPWPQGGATALSLTCSADEAEGLRSTSVAIGDTGLISTFSTEVFLRSIQRGGGTMLSLIRLALVLWQPSISIFFGVGVGNSLQLLISVRKSSSERRTTSLSENLAKG